MYLADKTWPELGDYVAEESVAVVPLGSTEQHGPHLPLATDHLIAEALAREAADRAGYLCTPTINVGVSTHHMQFHGTMSVDPPQFRDYVESFSRNLNYHGIDRIVYVNAHGGNMQHLREVGRRLREDEVAFAVEWMWDESIPELVSSIFEHNGPHGGPKETAMILHIAPELVREDKLEDARDGGLVESFGRKPHRSRRAELLRRHRQQRERRLRRPDRRDAREGRGTLRGGDRTVGSVARLVGRRAVFGPDGETARGPATRQSAIGESNVRQGVHQY